MDIPYEQLDRYFKQPKNISPFYENTRIPRKLKKGVKKFCGVHYKTIDVGQRLWYYLEALNPNYKRFIIKKIL